MVRRRQQDRVTRVLDVDEIPHRPASAPHDNLFCAIDLGFIDLADEGGNDV